MVARLTFRERAMAQRVRQVRTAKKFRCVNGYDATLLTFAYSSQPFFRLA